jgi:deferrochelatase/peroxidase EfeB
MIPNVYGKNNKTVLCNWTTASHYEKVDVNGDGKKERVGLNISSSKVYISVSKKLKASLKKGTSDEAKLEKMTLGKRHYLVLTIGEKEGVSEAMHFYQVSKKLKLTDCGNLAAYATKHFYSAIHLNVVACHNSSFDVEDTIEPNETGLMTITYTFKIKNHKLVRTSRYGQARLQNRKSLKVYVKQLSLYKSAALKNTGLSVSKGDVLTVSKIYEKNGKMALLIKKENKSGWLSLTTSLKMNQEIYKDHLSHGLFYNTGNYFGA